MWLVGEMWEGASCPSPRNTSRRRSRCGYSRSSEKPSVWRRPARRHCVMLATTPGEQHIVALRMVGNLLREAGYHVLMLGAEVPAWSLGDAADRHQVDVICISATLHGRTNETLRMIDEIRERRPATRFVIGGRGLRARNSSATRCTPASVSLRPSRWSTPPSSVRA